MSENIADLRAERRNTLEALRGARHQNDKLEDQKIEIERQLAVGFVVERALEHREEQLAEMIEKIEKRHVRPVADNPQA